MLEFLVFMLCFVAFIYCAFQAFNSLRNKDGNKEANKWIRTFKKSAKFIIFSILTVVLLKATAIMLMIFVMEINGF